SRSQRFKGSRLGNQRNEFRSTLRDTWASLAPWEINGMNSVLRSVTRGLPSLPEKRATDPSEPAPGVPVGAFGPRQRAILSILAGAYRLGKRPIGQRALDLLGLSISTGMIRRLERPAAADPEAPFEELREHVRRAPSAHLDETSWQPGRDQRWLWAAVTKSATVFAIAKSRGADVARRLLGSEVRLSAEVECDEVRGVSSIGTENRNKARQAMSVVESGCITAGR